MKIKMKFLGAAQNVTGSRHLLEANGTKVLVDCGLYQERQFRDRNWEPFTCPPESLDAVLLTHAHLDHCGLLPKLVKEGFKGRIYCTTATAEIAQIILLDSAHLQEEDAKYKRKRHKKEKRKSPRPIEPLYTTVDAEACFPQFSSVKYKQPVEIGPGVEATFCDAGHVLGSSIIRIKVSLNGQNRTVIFSGDIGRPDRPIVQDPAIVEQADYVLVESTYGDRVHQGPEDTKKLIAEVVNSTIRAGGNIVVPSFALERSQELLYFINELQLENAIPKLPVFLDSPMASRITKVFKKHRELYDEEMTEFVRHNKSPFEFDGLKMAGTSDESKAINHIKRTIMIIAGSGMCTGGRIKHHLVNNITKPENTIMFVGYQAVGTLGRRIVNGEKEVRILGQEYPVNARIARINGFSAHADKEELLEWLSELKNTPRKIFVVHGESDSANEFGDYLREKTGWQVVVPAYQDEVVLD
ncbi:MAG: MBL fold metallo-hydrolase RNA specificity domain-containing protein [Planctomycetota bacterium]|jgi:metallo-beta-lactamase family protein